MLTKTDEWKKFDVMYTADSCGMSWHAQGKNTSLPLVLREYIALVKKALNPAFAKAV